MDDDSAEESNANPTLYRHRRLHPPETWVSARRDYEEGDCSARQVADYYGMTLAALEKRAYLEKWRKALPRTPPPLLALPDPAQVIAGADDTIVSAWDRIAHEAQRPPDGNWSTWLFQGGRGAGKTRAGAEWLAARAAASPGGVFALIAPTQHDAREVMIHGVSGLCNLPGRERPRYETARRRLHGALFSASDVVRARGARPSSFDRVFVGVDLPASVGGSACGIVVAAREGDRYYVLDDCSASGLSPLGWASRVAEAAAAHNASAIIAEANQGGHMVRATLAQADVRCPIRLVSARHGKRVRAEPVAALYEQGRVTHCGVFTALEEDLMALGASEGDSSLDRADALVWALTALAERGGEGPQIRRL